MIPLWKGKNPIYFGVITIIPFDNFYRQAYFVMHTFLVQLYHEYQNNWERESSDRYRENPSLGYMSVNPNTWT